jgi:hypothetical protein
MPTPLRVPHLLSVPFLAELLAPSYASANRREAVEVYEEVKEGLAASRLHGPLCDAIWASLRKAHRDLEENELVERLAKALARKGGVRAREAAKPVEEAMAALFASIDLHIDRASDAMRAALETPAGQAARDKAIATAAGHLVALLKV